MTARERELRFETKMSDAEALMWTIEKDPWLNPSGAMLTILDRPLDFDAFRVRINNAAAEIPRMRERVVPGFGRLAPPTWATDPEFDLDYHLRRISLPAPATERQLYDLATRLYEDPYDRTRPLWMFVVIEGLEGGRAALFSKMHHTVTDGIGAMRLSERYLEFSIDEPVPEPIDLGAVIAASVDTGDDGNVDAVSPGETLLRSLEHVAKRQAGIAKRAIGEVATWTGDPQQARDLAEEAVATARATAAQVRADDDGDIPIGSPLWTGRSRRRHLESISLSLDDVKATGKALGGSVNDVFVTGITIGAIEYHRARGAKLAGLNASFVVSTRQDSAIGGNSFTPTLVPLPGTFRSPKKLLATIRDRMAERREGVGRGGGAMGALAGLANLLPTSVLTQVARSQAARLDFATSNLRGAPIPTYMSGALVERMIIMGPVAGTAMNITTMSYAGDLNIGLFIDPAAVDDPADLRECIEAGYRRLFEAAGITVAAESTADAAESTASAAEGTAGEDA